MKWLSRDNDYSEDSLGLFCFADTDLPVLLYHHIKHYKKLGIKKFHYILHKKDEIKTDECIELIKKEGCFYTIFEGQYSRFSRFYNLQYNIMNSKYDNILEVDLDEFVVADINKIVETGVDYTMGYFVDRISPDFPEFKYDVCPFDQFKINSTISLQCGYLITKMFLRKSWIQPLAPANHYPIQEHKYGFIRNKDWFPIYHFKWDKTCIERTKKRKNIHKNLKLTFSGQDDLLRFISTNNFHALDSDIEVRDKYLKTNYIIKVKGTL